MNALAGFNTHDRLLVFSLVVLTLMTLAVATEAHAFCQIVCIHGEAMLTDICSAAGR
jgi:hypothetical protein